MRALPIFVFLLLTPAAGSGQTFEQIGKQGNEMIVAKDLPGAEQFFRDAVEQARAAGDRVWEAEFERAIGETFERRFDYANARPQYQKALALRLAMGADAPPDNPKEIARLYGGVGLLSFYLRDDEMAETHVTKAIESYAALPDRGRQARNLTLLGLLHRNSGKLDNAQTSLKEALAIYEALGDKRGVGGALARLAEVSQLRGDYRLSLEWAFRAQDVQRSLDDPAQMAALLEIFGNTFGLMRQFDKALEYHGQCLELRLKINNPRDLAWTYSNIGALLASSHDFEGALSELTKALAIRRKLQSPADLAVNLNNIGSVQVNLGKATDAKASFAESLAICEKQSYARESATPLDSLGNLARLEGDLDQSLRYHTRALRAREQSGDKLGAVGSLTEIAEDLTRQGDLAGAEKRLAQALHSWQSLSQQVTDPAQLGTFRQAANNLYPRYAHVVFKRGRTADAFAIAEQARGAGLARMARLSTTDFIDLLEPEERKTWLAAAAGLGRAANHLRIAEQQPGGKSTRAAVDASAAFLQADRELSRLRDQIFATNPRLKAAGGDSGVTAADIVGFAKLHPGTLFAEWMVVDSQTTLLFAVTAKTGLRAYELPIGRAGLHSAVQAWYGVLGKRQGRGIVTKAQAGNADAEPKLAGDLYREAFGPIDELLDSGAYSRLVLVPDAALLRVPFGALLDGRGQRLMERFDVSTNVSLHGVLQPASRSRPRLSFYGIGDPLAAGEERLVVPFGFRFAPLEHAREEALSLGKLFPGGKVMTGPEAREAEVVRNIGQAAILHFATHGILAASDGLRSGLLLATEPEGSAEDGLLQAWEISGLALSARLAVLSACDTGQGDEQQGEGVMGLAWAFQAAGCPNIVASLWSVDDAATRELMLSFYRQLKTGAAVDGALRQAMLETSRKPGFASPYYWAAFQLIGRGGSALAR